MKRTKQPFQVSAILTADWHLREDQPVCRTDDFWIAQGNKIVEIASLQQHFKCPIIHAGDLFHHWKPSPLLLSLFIKNFNPNNKYKFYTVYGNHDLPQHNLELNHKSGTETLRSANCIEVLEECHWEQEPDKGSLLWPFNNYQILIWHVMTYQGTEPWPGCTDLSAKEILKQYPDYNIILTGHNHKTFIEEYENKLLVNPGSITRQTADQENHRPCVYFYDAKQNKVKRHLLNFNKGTLDRSHIEKKKQNEARYNAFIERLKQEGEPELSFRKNLEKHFQQNNTIRSVRKLITEKLED